MDFGFMWETFLALLAGIPLTLNLAASSVALGAVVALALALNTAAYASEIIRGGLQAVPYNQVEAARACGMSGFLLFRRIVFPIAVRQALPAYGSELILMVKATSLASVITMMELTGIAHKLISQTFRIIEVFVVAGLIYLILNFIITRIIMAVEWRD